jgi:hypothetical protein
MSAFGGKADIGQDYEYAPIAMPPRRFPPPWTIEDHTDAPRVVQNDAWRQHAQQRTLISGPFMPDWSTACFTPATISTRRARNSRRRSSTGLGSD